MKGCKLDKDMVVAEENIEYYSDKYNKLIKNTNMLCLYVNTLIKVN